MNYYGSLTGAAAYHAMMGRTDWATGHTEQEREAALIRASRAFDGRYGPSFSGHKATGSQRLAWPRIGAFDHCANVDIGEAAIPEAIIEAVYELAYVELLSPNSLSVSITAGRITQSETAGPLSRSFFGPADMAALFGSGNPLDMYRPTFSVVEDLVGCYINRRGQRWVATVV